MLKVYFIISLIKKKEIILDFMLEERDCLFPSLDLQYVCLYSTEIQGF